jgi:uncharacterized membrane protein (DUF2068 family)
MGGSDRWFITLKTSQNQLIQIMSPSNYHLPLQRKVEREYKRSNHFMRVIAVGRFLYGIVLLGLGLTIFNLIGKNLADELLALVNKLHISSHIYYVDWLLRKVSTLSDGLLILITVVNFFYAALAFIEALGLAFGKRWCYWLVIWDTASFLPIETHQLYKAFDWINFILLLYYLTTVIYLLWKLKQVPKTSNQTVFRSPLPVVVTNQGL